MMLSIVQPKRYLTEMSTLMKNDKTVLIGLLLSKGKIDLTEMYWY